MVCAITVAGAGCTSGITVRKVREAPLLADWQASAVQTGELSPRTQEMLQRLDMAPRYRRQPLAALAQLQALALTDPQPDYLFALAEISYQVGQTADRHDDAEAVAYYYLAAGYAYHYLFGPGAVGRGPWAVDKVKAEDAASHGCPRAASSLPAARCPLPTNSCPLPTAFDPRFRLACDLYNAGLSKCLRSAQRVGRLDPRQTLHVPTPDGQHITLAVSHHGFAWRPEEFGPLLFCHDYQVEGLDNHYQSYGLGVPLIGTRVHAPESAPGHAFYPHEVSFPATAFFRFEGSLADLSARRCGRLELYNPLAAREVAVAGRPVPLEADLTTPLAYFLSRTDLDRLEYTGFLRPDSLRDRTGIYLFEPYQPGKIPVLMIHGLLSSPVTWAPLFNDLRADPELNSRYQFWFYRYPTGNPYLESAADLRQALDRLRAELDPGRQDPAFDRMVLVGHSMGGLVSKLLTQDSGDDFWQLASARPFTELKASPEDRGELQRVFYFEKEVGVRRVIFLGTPHHGSKLSPSPPARLLARLVKLPERLRTVTADVYRDNPGLWKGADGEGRIPTSIDLLSPGSPALELLATRQAPPGVVYHSIIGVAFGQGESGSDGIVPYASAHLDGVASELVVPADHMHVHHHPRAVLEVRRILRLHVLEAPPPIVVPVTALQDGGK
jgi:pimeloyl-ACP methyl ester carboxylesterase